MRAIVSKKHIFVITFALIVVSATISTVFIVLRFKEIARMEKIFAQNVASQRLEKVFLAMNDFPGSAGKDVLLLQSLSSAQNFHNTSSKIISPELKSDFKTFLNNKDYYKDLFFYREDFNCIIRVSNESEYDRDACENPSLFFLKIIRQMNSLSVGEVFISPLLSYKDVISDGGDVPVILYFSPVNVNCSIISVIDANYFLEEFRRSARIGEQVFLLDSAGYYLANQDRSKEKLSGGISNFYNDFPDIPDNILSDANVRVFETDGKMIIFERIYPTESNFAVYEGVNKILGHQYIDEYFWVMAIVSDKAGENLWYKNLSYIMATVIVLVMHSLVLMFLFVIKFFIVNNQSNI